MAKTPSGPSKMDAPNPDKKAALNEALARMRKTFGEGTIMRLGEKTHMKIETTPTGSINLDVALGGGIPRGRLLEIFGAESSGKTTLTLHCIAEVQRAGGICAFIDAEHALDPAYAKICGVDIDNLYISQPDNGEQALEIADTLARSGAIDMIVIDSVAALVPRSEVEGEMGDQTIGLMARMMSQGCRKIAGTASRSGTTILFINQIREKVGVMYGSPETTPGGRALKFFASVRLRVSKGDKIMSGTEQIGFRTKVSIPKNKIAPPFREANFDLIFGEGISKYGDIVDQAVINDFIQKGGSWFTIGSERFQGKDQVKEYLRSHPDIAQGLEDQIKAKLLNKEEQVVYTEDDVDENGELIED